MRLWTFECQVSAVWETKDGGYHGSLPKNITVLIVADSDKEAEAFSRARTEAIDILEAMENSDDTGEEWVRKGESVNIQKVTIGPNIDAIIMGE